MYLYMLCAMCVYFWISECINFKINNVWVFVTRCEIRKYQVKKRNYVRLEAKLKYIPRQKPICFAVKLRMSLDSGLLSGCYGRVHVSLGTEVMYADNCANYKLM